MLDDLPPPALVALVRDLSAQLQAALAQMAVLEAEVAALRAGSAPPASGHPPKKTSRNASVPPAADRKPNRRSLAADASRPRRGARRGHPGHGRRRVAPRDIDVVVPCRPTHCGGCGSALPMVGGTVVGRRQVVEIPPVRPVVVEAQRLRLRCRHCQQCTTGTYPVGFGVRGTLGPRVVALAALLHEQHHVAYARLGQVFADVFGLQVSEGTLVAAVGELGQALQPAAAAIAEAVRQAPVIGSDETGVRIDGVTHWEWVFQTPTAAYHTIEPRRNTAVVTSFLAGAQPGVWVSDLWKPQLAAGAVHYQICLAHQLRDLEYARQAETGPARQVARAWAAGVRRLLLEAVHLRHQQDAGLIGAADSAVRVAEIERVMDGLLAMEFAGEYSVPLQRRFQTHRAGLWTFLHDPAVPPTNNASEQSLRPSVIHRKVTGGFRSLGHAQGYAALRTVLETARKRGENAFAHLLAAAGTHLPLLAQFHLAPLPSPTH